MTGRAGLVHQTPAFDKLVRLNAFLAELRDRVELQAGEAGVGGLGVAGLEVFEPVVEGGVVGTGVAVWLIGESHVVEPIFESDFQDVVAWCERDIMDDLRPWQISTVQKVGVGSRGKKVVAGAACHFVQFHGAGGWGDWVDLVEGEQVESEWLVGVDVYESGYTIPEDVDWSVGLHIRVARGEVAIGVVVGEDEIEVFEGGGGEGGHIGVYKPENVILGGWDGALVQNLRTWCWLTGARDQSRPGESVLHPKLLSVEGREGGEGGAGISRYLNGDLKDVVLVESSEVVVGPVGKGAGIGAGAEEIGICSLCSEQVYCRKK